MPVLGFVVLGLPYNWRCCRIFFHQWKKSQKERCFQNPKNIHLLQLYFRKFESSTYFYKRGYLWERLTNFHRSLIDHRQAEVTMIEMMTVSSAAKKFSYEKISNSSYFSYKLNRKRNASRFQMSILCWVMFFLAWLIRNQTDW